jgi:hypothetical protein
LAVDALLLSPEEELVPEDEPEEELPLLSDEPPLSDEPDFSEDLESPPPSEELGALLLFDG